MEHEYLSTITMGGFRGFAADGVLNCAIPTGRPGSGLTLIVGPNNSGKSAVLEAIKLAGFSQQPEIGRGVRNVPYGDSTSIRYGFSDGESVELRSIRPGSYVTEWEPDKLAPMTGRLYVVPARRSLSAHFGRATSTRWQFANQSAQLAPDRNETPLLNNRLIQIAEERASKHAFDEVVTRLLGHPLKWELDRVENGNYIFAIDGPTGTHTSDGLGFGILSVFYIVAGMFDADVGTMVCIDEPELSMHPQIQRRVAEYLAAEAARLQIVVSTHSPYFVNPAWLTAGAELARCYTEAGSSRIRSLQAGTKELMDGLVRDLNNPHVLGLDAREVFFAEEGVLVVEGQEDVVLLPRIAEQVGAPPPTTFFGWGAGGATKVSLILAILQDLGFSKVTSLVDGDKRDVSDKLKSAYPEYRHFVLPADDIRDKPAQQRAVKQGVCTDGGKVKELFALPMATLLREIGL